MGCINCKDNLHWECVNMTSASCCCNGETSAPVAEEEDDFTEDRSRTYKRESALKDQQSTGRKRAARKYPLDADAPCEWLGLKFAGGGKYPIIGCHDGLQQARHHGPDKNTLNNDEGNVHRICTKDHNRWHARNDEEYEPGVISNFHDAVTKATIEEIAANEVYWLTKKVKRVKD